MLRARSAAGLALAAALLSSLPYLVATTLARPGTQFAGFLLNPVDGFSYLAKMRQGAGSPFEFVLPYAAQPGPGALLFVYHLALGWLASALDAEPLALYHLARVAGGLLMLASVWALFSRAIASPEARRAALLLAVFGSGLGWLGLPFGLLANDLWVPESIPVLSTYANAHFALATALLVLGVDLVAFERRRPGRRTALAFGVGFGLALIQPFALLPLAASTGLWIGWELARGRELRAAWPRLSTLGALLAGGAPVVLYDWAATQVHPVLAAWAEQNVTPTPGVAETALGYGLILPLAAAGVFGRRTIRRPGGRLLLAWAAVGLLLLFAPLPLQRRMALGVYVPLAGLAGCALAEFIRSRRRQGLAVAAILALSLPSHLAVIGAGLQSVASGEPALVVSDAERESYRWAAAELPPGSLVLAGPRSGARLPAFADLRVVYGHPFETPQAERMQQTVRALYGWSGDPQLALQQLADLGVEFVWYGPEERALGRPSWLGGLAETQLGGDYRLYRIPAP